MNIDLFIWHLSLSVTHLESSTRGTRAVSYASSEKEMLCHDALQETCSDEVMHDILSFIQRHVLKQLRSRL